MTITALVLFVTVTGHWIVDVVTAFEAFVRPGASDFCTNSENLTPAERVYLHLADPKNIVGSGFYIASTVIGDSFMIYRLYIVWSRNKMIIIPPILLCLALAGSGAMVTFLFSQANQLAIFKAAGSWITVCFTLTFMHVDNLSIMLPPLIALRICQSNRALAATGAETTAVGLGKVVEIIIESAALYSCCVLLALATYASHSNVQFVFVAVTNAVIVR
ncbi:hypothetical protein BDQ17DRAFT_1244718 [Cyathus striatus]|nr:hypothetical protein BDQ17DRAFT_1244718 [Cyathus striatus]